MGTYGDKPRSRYKRRRIQRRVFVIVSLFALAFIILVIGGLTALNSVTVWKKFILPHYLGPYWETSVSYDTFDPMVLPPGMRIEGLRIHEPNQKEKPFVQIDEAVFEATLATRPDHIVLRTVTIDSVSVNFIRYDAEDTNMSRALNRIFEGRTPRSTGTWIPKGVFPEIETPPEFTIEALTLRFEDRSDPDSTLSLSFNTTDSIQVDAFVPEGGERGLLHRRWTAQSVGDFRYTHNDLHFDGEMTGSVIGRDLIDFPESELDVLTTLTPKADPSHSAQAQCRLPLNRISVRVPATPFEDFQLELFPSQGGDPLVRIDDGRLDPLTGRVQCSILWDAPATELYKALKSFLPPASIPAVESFIGRNLISDYLRVDSGGRLAGHTIIEAEGLFQYAIVDESERLPLAFEIGGRGKATGFGLGELGDLRSALLDQPKNAQEASDEVIADISSSWRMRLDENTGTGEAWFRADLIPFTHEGDSASTVSLVLCSANDPKKPMLFRPFRQDALAEARNILRGQEIDIVPLSPIVPRFRIGVGTDYTRSMTLMRLLDIIGADEMSLRQNLEVADRDSLLFLIAPLLDKATEVETGQAQIELILPGGARALQWQESFSLEGVEFGEDSTPTDFSGTVELVKDAERFDVEDIDILIQAENTLHVGADGSSLFPDEEPMWLDPETGDARIALEVDSLSPDIVDILKHIRISGLEQLLSLPLSNQILETVGLSDGDLNNGLATLSFGIQVDSLIRVIAAGDLRGIPVANLLSLPAPVNRRLEQANARFDLGFEINPEDGLLFPDGFSLSLYQGAEDEEPVVLQLQPEEGTCFRLSEFEGFLREEAYQLSEGVLANPKNLPQLLSGLLDRLQRMDLAMESGYAQFAIVVPGIDFGEWQSVLSKTGLPLESGVLSAAIRSTLSPREEAEPVEASGSFEIVDLKLAGKENPIPRIEGLFDMGKEDERLYVRGFETRVPFDESLEDTTIQCRISTRSDIGTMDVRLALDGVNAKTTQVLKQTESLGINEATALLDFLPTSTVVSLAGESGDLRMVFDGQQTPPGTPDRITLTQEGTGLHVLPYIFQPLSLQIQEEMLLADSGEVQLRKLDGSLHEEGSPSPVLSFSLDEPLALRRSGSDETVMRINVEKDFSQRPTFLKNNPLPIFSRFVTGGVLEGSFDILLPENRLKMDPNRLRISHDFLFNVRGLTLQGFPDEIDGIVRGEWARESDLYSLGDVRMDLQIDGQDTGHIELDTSFQGSSETLSGTAEFVGLRSPLLAALPSYLANWTRRPDSIADARMAFGVDYRPSTATMTLTLAGRNLGVPLDEQARSLVPPLNLDMQFTSHYDAVTSRVLVKNFHADVVAGNLESTDRLAPAGLDTPRILRVLQLGPIVYNARRHRLSSINPEGAGLEVVLGPLDMSEYGPLARELAGVPLLSGTLSGEGAIQSVGGGGARIDQAQLRLSLQDGLWLKNTDVEMPIEADLFLTGGTRTDVLRIDEIAAEVRYPEDQRRPRDQVTLRGFYEEEAQEKLVEIIVDSESLALDRIVSLVGDIQDNLDRSPAEETPAESDGQRRGQVVMDFLRGVSAVVTGRLNQITFRELVVPDIDVDARASGLLLTIEHLRSRLLEGTIDVTGRIDFADPAFPWSSHASLNRLEARPWINSFAPSSWQGDVSGKLTADLNVSGQGFRHGDLVESLQGRGVLELSEIQIRERGLGFIVGDDTSLEAKGDVLLRNNIARFRAETPWNPFRRIFLQGFARPVLPEEGEKTYYKGLLNFKRTTVVGPRDNVVIVDGRKRPIRQTIYGIVLELAGALGSAEKPQVSLRTVEY